MVNHPFPNVEVCAGRKILYDACPIFPPVNQTRCMAHPNQFERIIRADQILPTGTLDDDMCYTSVRNYQKTMITLMNTLPQKKKHGQKETG